MASVSAGWGHGGAVDTQGNLYTWGRPHDFRNVVRWIRSHQQTGIMLRSWQAVAGSVLGADFEPQHIPPPTPETVFTSVSCSPGALTAVLDDEGAVWSFGSNTHGQCGTGATSQSEYAPVRAVGLDQPVVQVACGFQFTLARTADGRLWAWGKGGRGQLGLGDNDTYKAPVPLDGEGGLLAHTPFAHVDAGFSHGVGVTVDGAVYVWGRHRSPVVVPGRQERFERDAWSPVQLHLPVRAVTAACGQAHTAILGEDGSVWMLGLRGRGLLFDNTRSPEVLEGASRRVEGGGSQGALTPTSASTLGVHDVALTSDPRFVPETDVVVHPVRMPDMPWGGGGSTGRLGGGSAVVSLRAGLHHTYAVLDSGAVWRWGWRGVPEVVAPVAAAGVAVKDIALGFHHAMLLARPRGAGQEGPELDAFDATIHVEGEEEEGGGMKGDEGVLGGLDLSDPEQVEPFWST